MKSIMKLIPDDPDIGMEVIDTKTNKAATIVGEINKDYGIYVVEDYDDNVYLVNKSRLIEYDKRYFDRIHQSS